MGSEQRDSEQAVAMLLLALHFTGEFKRARRCQLVELLTKGEEGLAGLRRESEFLSANAWNYAERELNIAQKNSVQIVSFIHSDYPWLLREIPDPPLLLFVRGKLPENPCVSVVGSRYCSSYGRRCAANLAREIAGSGGAVVSGLAVGIDTAAHEGALSVCGSGVQEASGISAGIAVLGSGVLRIYPPKNAKLAEQILSHTGAVISEYGLSLPPLREHFPERNRIISGLSEALVVVEAKERSGALITARLALEQGREVFAVPGPVDSRFSVGTNHLIQEGASVLRDLDDIRAQVPRLKAELIHRKSEPLYCTNVSSKTSAHTVPEFDIPMTPTMESVIKALESESYCHFDTLVEKTGLKCSDVRVALSTLEVSGRVFRSQGDFYSVNEYVDTA